MSSRNDRFEYRPANVTDGPQILEILESGSFSGDISVLYTRRPNPVVSLEREGEQVMIPVMVDRENNRICGVGCCAIRKTHLNGKVIRAGYLTGLRIHPDYRRRLPGIAKAYARFYEEAKGEVDLFYTTILKENVTAQKLLEKKRPGMPEYRYKGEYTVYCLGTGRRQPFKEMVFARGLSPRLRRFMEEELRKNNLSPAGIDLPGIRETDFYSLQDGNGRILAACALWNRQQEKQYIITGYHGIYRLLRYLPLNLLGYPSLPAVNVPARDASIALLCVRDQHVPWAVHLIRKAMEEGAACDFLMAGCFENHPLQEAFRQIRHIPYQSRLYTVHWEDDGLSLDERPIQLEVGFL